MALVALMALMLGSFAGLMIGLGRGLADDVRRHVEGLPVVARGDSWTYRTVRFVRRRKLGVAAAAAIVLTLIAVSAAGLVAGPELAAVGALAAAGLLAGAHLHQAVADQYAPR